MVVRIGPDGRVTRSGLGGDGGGSGVNLKEKPVLWDVYLGRNDESTTVDGAKGKGKSGWFGRGEPATGAAGEWKDLKVCYFFEIYLFG